MKHILVSLILFLWILLCPKICFANIGVGINSAQIKVDEKLKAGMVYQLPSISIINTGDEPGEYIVNVAYQQENTELRPDKNWFEFSPSKFYLQPKESQLVNIKINLPLKIDPGDYFCYLEGRAVNNIKRGGTVLGVAAGTKLYFSVVPANFIYGIYNKVTSLYQIYQPWSQRILIALLIIILILIIKKIFHIEIKINKPPKKS